uniref:Uncharacterized protein n=1 Tax=viral metagenome TaxID=1070528 RepID=A0A6M3KRE2_9ZZZZ
MDKVYMVTIHYYTGSREDIEGIYSNQEAAEKHVAAIWAHPNGYAGHVYEVFLGEWLVKDEYIPEEAEQ